MIDVRELRIGNWLALGNYFIEICKITFEQNVGWIINEAALKDLSPVPLTPELLEKCANNKVGKDGYRIAVSLDRMQSLFITPALMGCAVELFSYGTSKSLSMIHSLHQLQNLIYILSGNELNVEI